MKEALGSVRSWIGVTGLLGAGLVVGGATGSGSVAAPPGTGWADAYRTPVPQVSEAFPHEEHEGLFPLCTGCHEGVPDGDPADYYPPAETCEGCHDGVDQERVEYEPPEPGAEPDNLAFEHFAHSAEVDAEGDEALECGACHARPGASRMSVEPLDAEQCLSCHGHQAENHVEDAECTTCHVPLASTELPVDRIASMTVPEDHLTAGFVLEGHGERSGIQQARCATCHTQERCLTCHVDGADESAIRAIPVAGPQLELPPAVAHYPMPESHTSEEFERLHGPLSEERSCSTCHTRNDCSSCHLEPLPRTASTLPLRETVVAPGVGLMVDAPASHADPYFMNDHPSMAAADPTECASCHTESFCASCHDAPQDADFHPPNYVAQHSADAWNQTAECATCHDVAVYCRSCHVSSGFGGEGRLESGYHDAEPLWLLRHGQAARQSLETCASCHTQRQCLQCHSTTGSFQVNPHGSDFDARRAWERNPGICLACHIESPFGGTP